MDIDLAEFVLNAALCAGVVAMRGNVSRLLKPFGVQSKDRRNILLTWQFILSQLMCVINLQLYAATKLKSAIQQQQG
jgi:hypothetical protein